MKKTRDGKREQAAESAPASLARRQDSQEQSRLFEEGIRLFQGQEFGAAAARFEAAARGPVPEMAHAARLRRRICERRLAAGEPQLAGPAGPEDHYNYAIALMNQRRWDQAETHLMNALAQSPNADHLYYALALCRGSRGDLAGAYRYMKHAIELQPRNLVTARNDPDFAELCQQPPLSELLNPERTPPL